MSVLLSQLVYTSFAQVGYKTVVSANVPQQIQQAFIQQVVYQYWDAFNPPPSGYQAAYLYQVSLEQSLFGWLYNDGLDDFGRTHVPYFVCYYLAQRLHAVQLENILTCLHKGPIALINRYSLPTTLETIALTDLENYQPARMGVEIPLTVRDRSYVALQQRQLLNFFIPVDERKILSQLNKQLYKQQKPIFITNDSNKNLNQNKLNMRFTNRNILSIKGHAQRTNQIEKAGGNENVNQSKPLNESVVPTKISAFDASSQINQILQLNKIALLIGVSDYGHDFEPLPRAQKDVEAMQQILQNPEIGSFSEVRTLLNPNRQVMEEAIETVFSERQENDLVLLYFSGYGIKDDSGKLYLTTTISRKSENQKIVKSSAVLASFIDEIVSDSRSKHQILILDCCFSGISKGCSESENENLVNVENQLGGEGRVILTSSTSSQCVFEQNKSELSIYTHYLIEGMETGAADLDKNGLISIKELHDYTSRQVKKAIPAMQPGIYGVEDYHQFVLANASVDDPKRKYREKAECCVVNGEISVISRSILNMLRETLGLLPDEAAAIEARVLEPYREYQKRLQRYVNKFVEAIHYESSLSDETRKHLKNLQLLIGLRDEDVTSVEAEITRQINALEFSNQLREDELEKKGESLTPVKVINNGVFSRKLVTELPIKSELKSASYSTQKSSKIEEFNHNYNFISSNKKLWLVIGFGIIVGIVTLTSAIYARIQWQDSQRLKTIEALTQQRNYEECIAVAKTISKNSIYYSDAQTLLKQCEAGVSWQNVQLQTLSGHSDTVWSIALSPDGQTLASGSSDNKIKIWNLGTGKLLRTLSGHSDTVWSVAFSPAGQTLASGSSDNKIKIWNLGSGELIRTFSGHSNTVRAVAFSSGGQTLVSGSNDKKIKIWNLGSGMLRTLSGHSAAVRTIALAGDGQILASGSSDNTIKIWNLGSGKLLHTLSGHKERVISIALSRDGQTLASGSADKTIKIWNLSSGKLLHTLSGLSDGVGAVAISPNGLTLASGVGKMLQIWDFNTFKLLHNFPAHSSNITSISFSANGKQLVSGSQDKTINILWR